MKGIFTKKVLVIVSVVLVIVLGAVLLAFTTGRTYYPNLSNPDEVFYQRVDDSGNVLYEITNKEMFEEIKGNDGITQLLYMIDSLILEDYIDLVTADEIADKILQLTYGTSDPTVYNDFSDEEKEALETAFSQSMLLAGYSDNPGNYAKLLVAREKFVLEKAIENNEVTGLDVVQEYYLNYFEDIMAIKIRFTSLADARNVMEKYNLVSSTALGIREYLGYVYLDEDLLDGDDNIVEAQISIDTYYFDEDENILDLDENIVYTKSLSGIYTDEDETQYRININGDLEDYYDEIIISNTLLFDSLAEAETYKENNSEYFTVNKVDPFDELEDAQVLDDTDTLVYTIDSDGHIYDTSSVDVTDTTDLVVNKVFKNIEDVTAATENNSTELTDEELLAEFIDMYNYVYGEYRDSLTVGSTINDLVTAELDDLTYNFDDLVDITPAVAYYMFETLDTEDTRYTKTPESIETGNQSFYYLIFKLDQEDKEDVSEIMFDLIESTINIPTQIATSIDLPTESYYESTITWKSETTALIDNTGVVVNPTSDTEVDLTYTIKVMGLSRTETITVTILASGENSAVTDNSETEMTYEELINDAQIYSDIEDKLYEEFISGEDAKTNINSTLNSQRALLGFQIHDYFLSLDYSSGNADYVYEGNGDKTLIATLDKTLNSEVAVEITADEFFEYALNHKAGLYTLYATQLKELISSAYYEELYGTQRDLLKNNTDRMEEILSLVTEQKSYFSYLKNLYAQYNIEFTYASFIDYAYSQFSVKSESELLGYFVSEDLQAFLINESNNDADVISLLKPSVDEYYDNYFSLYATQILAYIDFDEDGSPDDFDDYKATLTDPADLAAFNALQASLENTLDIYTGTFSELVTEYNDSARDDATWGDFKQNGFLMLTESLNPVDEDGVEHSITYAGEYGVKDSYVDDFVTALVDLYNDYRLPSNVDKSEYDSPLIQTQFGFHFVKVTPGDDFDKPSFAFTEEDSANPQYTVGIENVSEKATTAQLEAYAQYKFYSMIYDLTEVNVEEKYDIDVPSFPESLSLAYNAYFDELLSSTYVLGVVKINLADKLVDGEFVASTYLNLDNATVMASLDVIKGVYYDAVFSKYETE